MTLADKVASGIMCLRLMEDVLHGDHAWEMRAGNERVPAFPVVSDDGISFSGTFNRNHWSNDAYVVRDGETVWAFKVPSEIQAGDTIKVCLGTELLGVG